MTTAAAYIDSCSPRYLSKYWTLLDEKTYIYVLSTLLSSEGCFYDIYFLKVLNFDDADFELKMQIILSDSKIRDRIRNEVREKEPGSST